jgi:hypothetical protein
MRLDDFIYICNDSDDSFSCSVSEQRFSDSSHFTSASVSMFDVGDSAAALAFSSSNSSGLSVQQQPFRRRASDGSNIFGFSLQHLHHSIGIKHQYQPPQHLRSSMRRTCAPMTTPATATATALREQQQ